MRKLTCVRTVVHIRTYAYMQLRVCVCVCEHCPVCVYTLRCEHLFPFYVHDVRRLRPEFCSRSSLVVWCVCRSVVVLYTIFRAITLNVWHVVALRFAFCVHVHECVHSLHTFQDFYINFNPAHNTFGKLVCVFVCVCSAFVGFLVLFNAHHMHKTQPTYI